MWVMHSHQANLADLRGRPPSSRGPKASTHSSNMPSKKHAHATPSLAQHLKSQEPAGAEAVQLIDSKACTQAPPPPIKTSAAPLSPARAAPWECATDLIAAAGMRKRGLAFDAPDNDSASSPSATKHCTDRRHDSDAFLTGLPAVATGGASPMSPRGDFAAPVAFDNMPGVRPAAEAVFDSSRTHTASSQTHTMPSAAQLAEAGKATPPAAADAQHAQRAAQPALPASRSLPPYAQHAQPGLGATFRALPSDMQDHMHAAAAQGAQANPQAQLGAGADCWNTSTPWPLVRAARMHSTMHIVPPPAAVLDFCWDCPMPGCFAEQTKTDIEHTVVDP